MKTSVTWHLPKVTVKKKGNGNKTLIGERSGRSTVGTTVELGRGVEGPRLHAETALDWLYPEGLEGTREGAGQALGEQHCLSSSLASPKPGGGSGGHQLGDAIEGPGDKGRGAQVLLLGSTSTQGKKRLTECWPGSQDTPTLSQLL